jgi:DNA invertase Pin-like site-specific DNA recombinase
MSGKNLGYIRVSSFDQNPDRQLEGLRLDKVFTDKASGLDTNRPQLKAMIDFIREDDKLFIHSMDRLARDLGDLRKIVNDFTSKGITIHFVKEGLTFTNEESPMSKLLLSVMGAVAEFERSIIKERQREGIEIGKRKGIYKGRKAKLKPEQVEDLMQKISLGIPKTKVAKDLGIKRSTLYLYLNKSMAKGGKDG